MLTHSRPPRFRATTRFPHIKRFFFPFIKIHGGRTGCRNVLIRGRFPDEKETKTKKTKQKKEIYITRNNNWKWRWKNSNRHVILLYVYTARFRVRVCAPTRFSLHNFFRRKKSWGKICVFKISFLSLFFFFINHKYHFLPPFWNLFFVFPQQLRGGRRLWLRKGPQESAYT